MVIINKKFLDFDRHENHFVNNLYLDDYKIVVKMPLTKNDRDPVVDVRIEKFDLAKYTYLLSYD